MRIVAPPIFLIVVLVLTACATLPQLSSASAARAATLIPSASAGVDPFAPPSDGLTRVDQQGAVIVEITPPDLAESFETLDFSVALNTHSINLSMDLAVLSTLQNDSGMLLRASRWDAARGGHHVRGTLSFPTSTNSRSILEGAHTLTLTIRNLDAPARVFVWELK